MVRVSDSGLDPEMFNPDNLPVTLSQAELHEIQTQTLARTLKAKGKIMDDEVLNQVVHADYTQTEWYWNAQAPPPLTQVKNLTMEQWTMILEACNHLHSLEKELTREAILKRNRRIKSTVLNDLIKTPEFQKALQVRGITAQDGSLTSRQMLALSVLSDFSDKRSLSAKLKKAGIKQWEFDAWNANPTFRKAYRDLSEKVFDRAQAPVNIALSQMAVGGDLQSIKYFNEISGRWNPATQSNMDARHVLKAVIEVLTSTIQDPELLQEISSKLQLIGTSSRMIEG